MQIVLEIPDFARFDPDLRSAAERFYWSLTREILRQEIDLKISVARTPNFDTPPPAGGKGQLRIAYHAHECGQNCWTVKGSALPGLWHFEPKGYSGWSYLAHDPVTLEQAAQFDLARAEDVVLSWRKAFETSNLSKYRQPDDVEPPKPGYLFYPLQVNGDRVLNWLPLSQVEVLEQLQDLADGPDRRVVIKRHPKCESTTLAAALARVARNPWIDISEASVHRLLPASRAVLVANSGVGLEALIHGKPVFSMAASEYRHLTHPIDPMLNLAPAFAEATPMSGRQIRQLGWFLDHELLSPDKPDQIADRLAKALGQIESPTRTAEPPKPDVATVTETLRRHLGEQLLLLLEAPASAEHERFFLRSLKMGESVSLISRRAPLAFLGKAVLYFYKTGKLDLAEDLALAILRRDPKDGHALATLARLRFSEKRDAEALEFLAQAVDAPQATASTHILYARKIRALPDHNPDLIRTHAERAIALEDGSVAVLAWAARLLAGVGDRGRATDLLDKARAIQPDHPDIAKAQKDLRAAVS